MMPLVMGNSGQAYEIRKIGGNDEVRTHLASMGFVPGAKVTLVSVNNGSVIVNVKNVRVGISDVGETVKVVKLHGTGAVKRRIMDMGITKGAEIYVRKVAPLGDPVEVNVRGYELTVRRADAEMVEITD